MWCIDIGVGRGIAVIDVIDALFLAFGSLLTLGFGFKSTWNWLRLDDISGMTLGPRRRILVVLADFRGETGCLEGTACHMPLAGLLSLAAATSLDEECIRAAGVGDCARSP